MRKLILVLACAIIAGSAIANADEKLVDLVKKVKPGVVLIETFDKDNKPIGRGSGFFIDNKGSLITNHHVIEGAYSATIKTSAGKEYPVQGIVAKDTEADIVKLVVNLPDANITFLNLSENVPSEGEDIFVIGNPLGLESTVSSGIVSAVRDIPAFGKILQITAPISPGSSGSPVINSKGEVIGIATLIVTEGQNLNFAIPSDKIIALKETPKTTISESYNVLTADSNDAQSFYDKGLKELWQENYSAALTYFQKATAENSQDANTWFFDGYCYSKLDRNEEAIISYKQAIQLQPDDASAYFNLSCVYYKLGYWPDVVEVCKQAIRIKPDLAEAYTNLGFAYRQLDRWQEAIEAYKEAIQIKPDLAEAHTSLGAVYIKLGRYQDAIEACKQAIRINPNYAEAHLGLGITYLLVSNKNASLEEYKILKNLDEESANRLFNAIYSSDDGETEEQAISENARISDTLEPFLYHNSEGHFSLTIPAGWTEISKDTIAAYVKMLREEFSDISISNYDAAFQKTGVTDFAYPYIMLQIDKRGRWSEKETKKLLSSDEWEKAMQQGVDNIKEQHSNRIQNLRIGQTIYDKEKNIVFAKMKTEVAGVGKVIAITAVILNNYGAVNLYCYSTEDDFENYLPYFTQIVNSFRYDIGYEYNQITKNQSSDTASGSLWGIGLIAFICVGLAILAVIIIRRKSSGRSNNSPETLQPRVSVICLAPHRVKIRNAWIVGIVYLGFTLLGSFSNTWMWIDVVILSVLSFGIYKRNRFCGVSMVLYTLLNIICKFIKLNEERYVIGIIANLIFLYFFIQGMLAIISYHRLSNTSKDLPSEDEEGYHPTVQPQSSPNEPTTPTGAKEETTSTFVTPISVETETLSKPTHEQQQPTEHPKEKRRATACPHCKGRIYIDTLFNGRNICPHCEHAFTVKGK